MFGSGFSPRTHNMQKEASHCSAGVFTAPIALQVLTELFLEYSNLENLQAFISDNAKNIYKNIEVPEKRVVLEKEKFIVPDKYGEVVPMYAGEELSYSIVDVCRGEFWVRKI